MRIRTRGSIRRIYMSFSKICRTPSWCDHDFLHSHIICRISTSNNTSYHIPSIKTTFTIRFYQICKVETISSWCNFCSICTIRFSCCCNCPCMIWVRRSRIYTCSKYTTKINWISLWWYDNKINNFTISIRRWCSTTYEYCSNRGATSTTTNTSGWKITKI